jgi:hypothetical protein
MPTDFSKSPGEEPPVGRHSFYGKKYSNHRQPDQWSQYRTPIESGDNPPDQVKIYAENGTNAVLGDPLFRDAAR